MINFVVEFGGLHFEPFAEMCTSLLASVGGEDSIIEILTEESEGELEYQKWVGPLKGALQKFQQGAFKSVWISSREHTKIFSCLVFAPKSLDGPSGTWYGSVDCFSLYEEVSIRKFCKINGLKFISLSIEDTLDIDDLDDISFDHFPWKHWRLVEACVWKNHENKVPAEVIKGPAFKRVVELESSKE